jgi:hypothetical protein
MNFTIKNAFSMLFFNLIRFVNKNWGLKKENEIKQMYYEQNYYLGYGQIQTIISKCLIIDISI